MKTFEVVLPQDRDTRVEVFSAKPYSLRYASVRSSDSKETNQNGQDYISVFIEGKRLAFSVCDGVSQSFYGDLASSYLGQRLIMWLLERMPHTLDEAALAKQLTDYLNDASRHAANVINNHPVPKDVSELLAEVLEEKRKRGSETTFVCGFIELPNKLFKEGRALFSWMGNCRLRLGTSMAWGDMLVENPDDDKGKWSTHKGPASGKVHLKALTLVNGRKRRFNRILAYTDGLALLDTVAKRPDDSELDQLIEKAVDSNYSDDCSLLEIELKP